MGIRITDRGGRSGLILKMANLHAMVFYDVLAIALCELAAADSEKKIALWFCEHDISVIGNGAEFDLADFNWTPESFHSDKSFVLRAIEFASSDAVLGRLSYAPDLSSLMPFLQTFKSMLTAREMLQLPETQISEFHPKDLQPLGRCPQHGVFLHEHGCIVCNNEPARA